VQYHSLYRLLGFGVEGEVWEVIALEVSVGGYKIRHFFRNNSGPISGASAVHILKLEL
jgi:hypothetical protein